MYFPHLSFELESESDGGKKTLSTTEEGKMCPLQIISYE